MSTIFSKLFKKEKAPSVNGLEDVLTQQQFVGSDATFAGRESYKLLRTNVMFSLVKENNNGAGKIIGITSSLPKEGKSLTAINLAYSFAETKGKVLLIDCDLRMSSLSQKLGIRAETGLTDLLVGIEEIKDVLCRDILIPNLDFIPAGHIPPNPSELLGSRNMQSLLNEFVKYYDYIILDLPPVTAVADPLVVSKNVDGIVMVARLGYVRNSDFNESMRQLKFVNANILGIALNGGSGASKHYKKKYGRYGKNYGYDYGYGERKKHSKKKEDQAENA